MICSFGFWSMQSPVEHLPISYASNFIQMVLSLLASSSWIVSGHPVTGSKSFPAIVASWWLMLTMCDGRATLGATTGVDSTLGGRTWWYVLDWGDMWMAWSSILATSAKSLRTGGPKFRGEIALHLEFFKRYNMLAWICFEVVSGRDWRGIFSGKNMTLITTHATMDPGKMQCQR